MFNGKDKKHFQELSITDFKKLFIDESISDSLIADIFEVKPSK